MFLRPLVSKALVLRREIPDKLRDIFDNSIYGGAEPENSVSKLGKVREKRKDAIFGNRKIWKLFVKLSEQS